MQGDRPVELTEVFANLRDFISTKPLLKFV
jgi:hypothetical protein